MVVEDPAIPGADIGSYLAIIALPWAARKRVRDLVQRLAMTPVQIRLAPDLLAFDFGDRSFTSVGGMPMLHLFDRPIDGWSSFVKSVS